VHTLLLSHRLTGSALAHTMPAPGLRPYVPPELDQIHDKCVISVRVFFIVSCLILVLH
jgi:hypothetical protein